MKKIIRLLALLVVTGMLLSSCSFNKEKPQDQPVINITKNDILRNNSRESLASRHVNVTEKTNYHFLDESTPDWSWELSYGKVNDTMSASIKYADYECYYLNGEIYVLDEMPNIYGVKNYSRLVHFQEEYDKIVSDLLLTDNILRNVYISGQHTEYHDEGYISTFEITVTGDIVEEFNMWNVKLHDKMTVVYILNKDLEIQSVSFYYNREKNKDPIVTTQYIYNMQLTYPEQVKAFVESTDKSLVKITQNYGLPSEYSEDYYVANGCKIQGNANLLNRYVYTDLKKKTLWNYSFPITNDTNLYVTG